VKGVQIMNDNEMTPLQEAFEGFKLYLLATYVKEGFRTNKLPIGFFSRNLLFEGYNISPPWETKNLPDISSNLYSVAFGSACFVGLNAALERTFKGPPSKKAVNLNEDMDAARVIVYCIRNAYAHYPANPRWNIMQDTWRDVIRIKEIDYSINLREANGKEVRQSDYGGWDGFLKLFMYCFKKIAEKGNDYSRSINIKPLE
jgi:hypothetical protein